MGRSTPPRSNIDLVHSYARLRGEDVELVLARPAVTITRRHPVVVLRHRRHGTVVEAPADVEIVDGRRRLLVRVRRADLSDGVWRLVLRPGTGPVILGARLLVQGERPLVLLMGATGSSSRVPAPRPRKPRPTPKPAPAATGAWPGVRGVGRRTVRLTQRVLRVRSAS